MGNLNFDARTVNPSTPFEPVPANNYRVSVSNSEMRQNKSANGEHLALEFTILDGGALRRTGVCVLPHGIKGDTSVGRYFFWQYEKSRRPTSRRNL